MSHHDLKVVKRGAQVLQVFAATFQSQEGRLSILQLNRGAQIFAARSALDSLV